MSDEETYSVIRTILGRTHRDRRWHLTDEVDVTAVLGSAKFDLRAVESTGNDVAEIRVACYLGKVDLVVPEGTVVVMDGTSFLASSFSDVADGPAVDLPRLEVTATTVLGRVRVRSAPAEVPAAEIGSPADQEQVVDEIAARDDEVAVVDEIAAPDGEVAVVDEIAAGDEVTAGEVVPTGDVAPDESAAVA